MSRFLNWFCSIFGYCAEKVRPLDETAVETAPPLVWAEVIRIIYVPRT